MSARLFGFLDYTRQLEASPPSTDFLGRGRLSHSMTLIFFNHTFVALVVCFIIIIIIVGSLPFYIKRIETTPPGILHYINTTELIDEINISDISLT